MGILISKPYEVSQLTHYSAHGRRNRNPPTKIPCFVCWKMNKTYEEQRAAYCNEAATLQLTCGALLLQISIGKKKSAEWGGCAKKFHWTTNADVKGVYARIMQFVMPKRPSKPDGYHSKQLAESAKFDSAGTVL